MPSNVTTVSAYIIALAGAARTAMATMSTGEFPMAIKVYTFTYSIGADLDFNSQTDVSLNLWGLKISEKLTLDIKTEWSLKIECSIVPSVTLPS